MRRFDVVLAGFCLVSTAAIAQELPPYPGDPVGSGFYAGLRGSLAFQGKDGAASVPTAPPTALRGSHDTGGGAAIVLGAYLPFGLRIEAEAVYHKLPETGLQLGGAPLPAGGFRDVAAPMGNLIWDLPVGDFPVRPFIGAGAGMAYTHSRLQDPVGGNVYLQNSAWHFAYQGLAGFTIPVSSTARVSAMYRYTRVNNVAGKCGTGGAPTLACRTDNADQSVDLGLELDLP